MSDFNVWRGLLAGFTTVYFCAIFLASLIYALWPRNQQNFDEAAQIPLQDDRL